MKYIVRVILLTLLLPFLTGSHSEAQRSGADSLAGPDQHQVILPIAYGAQPAWMVTGAHSTVKGKELSTYFNTNLANALAGRLPGITVLEGSGEPGLNGPAMFGRGINTFGGAGRELLLMVDGYENSIGQLSADEVETVTFLKDAAATALYGSRGANGVLLITTRRGREGLLKVNFSVQQGINKPKGLPKFLRSYDYASLYNEALINDGKPALYTAGDLQAYKTGGDPYVHPDVNWYDQVLRKSAAMGNYHLDFSGGNKMVRYFVALNALRSDGLYIKAGDINEASSNSKYNRYNFRSNVDIDLNKRFSACLTLAGVVDDKTNPAANSTTSTFGLLASLPPNAFPVHTPDGSYGGSPLYTNPLGNLLETGSYTSNARTLQSSLRLTHQLDMILPGLSASVAISSNNYFNSYSNKSSNYVRLALSKNPAGDTVYTRYGQKTSLVGDESRSDQWRNYALQAFVNYQKKWKENEINALLMGNSDNYTISGDNLPYKHVSWGSRITFANQQKYIAELAVSYMGSENFPKGKRFGLFPAVSAGWVASKEGFLQDNKIISYLKIKASYGLAGNDKIGGQRFMFDQMYPFTSSPYFGVANSALAGIAEGSPANPNVTWEKEKKLNLGLEASIGSRLDLQIDLFNQDRYDILAQPNLTMPLFVGVPLPYLNVGKSSNKGLEAVLRYHNKPGAKMGYFVEGSVWYARNKIVYNAEAVQLNKYLYATGRAIDQPFLLQATGFFKDQADIDASPRQSFTAVQPGDIKYKDQNGDNIIDQNDVIPSGNTNVPKLTLSLHGGVQYKGFDLDVWFQGVTGNTVYLGPNYYAFQNNGQVGPMALGRWTPATASSATYPRLSSVNNLNNFRYSTFWQRNGSFIKLRSLELGYSLQLKPLEKIRIEKMRVFVNGTNLFSIDHIPGDIDPESLSGYYPTGRTLSAGVKLQF